MRDAAVTRPPPAPVAAMAAGRPVREAWENELGGRTFEVGAGARRCFVKWTPVSSEINLSDEAARLAWAVSFTPVPRARS
jgi:kanamycin kinase